MEKNQQANPCIRRNVNLVNVGVNLSFLEEDSHFGDGKEYEPSTSSMQQSQPCRQFEYTEILKATEDFAESLVIGRGGFGKVYKGYVINGSSLVVAAIKRLDFLSNQGEPEFWAEVEMLSMLRHCNLVSLIGYCNYEQEKILIYEYMPNGTLSDHLHNFSTPLSWLQRLDICIGAGRGLHYLHTGMGIQSGVIHRDVKSSNILLQKSWAAKISDFGLSKIGPTNQPSTYVNTLIKGTFGYLDPDYFATGRLTRKSDVYAFGVVLLEVLCRRRAVDRTLDDKQWSLATWAQDSIKEGNLKRIIDSDIRGEISPKCLKVYVRIVKRCLSNTPKQRPTMAEVVVGLESVLALQEKFYNSLKRTMFGRMLDKLSFLSIQENSMPKLPTTEPLMCDPSQLPVNPPSKEFGARFREEEARRQKDEAMKGHVPESRMGARELKAQSKAQGQLMVRKYNPRVQESTELGDGKSKETTKLHHHKKRLRTRRKSSRIVIKYFTKFKNNKSTPIMVDDDENNNVVSNSKIGTEKIKIVYKTKNDDADPKKDIEDEEHGGNVKVKSAINRKKGTKEVQKVMVNASNTQTKTKMDKKGNKKRADGANIGGQGGTKKRLKRRRGAKKLLLYDESDEMVACEIEGSKPTRKRNQCDRKRRKATGKKGAKDAAYHILRNRVTQVQIHETIQGMSKKQLDAVKSMGFGRILKMGAIGVPARISHFVVDRFNQKSMEIDLGSVKVKADKEAIHQLFGIPNRGIRLADMNKKTRFVGLAKTCRDRYAGSFITKTEIGTMIEKNKDDDGILFKLDFLVLFMSSFVEIQGHGKCKAGFVRCFTDEMDPAKIDWCSYIEDSMRSCKEGWDRLSDKYFTGAVPILLLLYVDRVSCVGMDVERQMSPLKFWTIRMLRRREEAEIENGGFGLGELRDPYVNQDDDEGDVEALDEKSNGKKGADGDGDGGKVKYDKRDSSFENTPEDQKHQLIKIVDMIQNILSKRNEVDNALRDAHVAWPENAGVGKATRKFTSIFRDAGEVNVSHMSWTQFLEENMAEIVQNENKLNKDKSVKSMGDTSPSTFHLLSQCSQETVGEVVDLGAGNNSKVHDGKTNDVDVVSKTVEELVDINAPMEEEEKLIWQYLMATVVDKREAEKRKHDEEQKGKKGKKVDEEDKYVRKKEKFEEEDMEVQQSFLNDIFSTAYGLETKAFLINTLLPGSQIYGNVVDCWAAVLNHQQRYKNQGEPKCLFCYTRNIVEWVLTSKTTLSVRVKAFSMNLRMVVEGLEDKMDLRSFDIVVLPILDNNHFFMMSFDLKNVSISIIDNMEKSILAVKNNTNFWQKSIHMKVKEIVCRYLAVVKHPKAKAMKDEYPKRLKLPWQTTDNVTDSGVFLMRHMEAFKGNDIEFKTGFNTDEKVKSAQLTNLRMKYAARILLSDANVHKEKVMSVAVEVAKMMKESSEYEEKIRKLCGYEEVANVLRAT